MALIASLTSFTFSGEGLSISLTTKIASNPNWASPESRGWRSSPTLGGLHLGQDLSTVTMSLGKGHLVYTSPEYVEQKETRYEWRTSKRLLEVGFSKDDRIIYIGLSAKTRTRSIAGVYLNKDTMRSVRAKLGRPDKTEGPDLDETMAYFSLVYLVGPRHSQEVHFVSDIDWDRLGLNTKSLSARLFAKRQVVKVFIRES